MAVYSSRQVLKKHTNRGNYSLSNQSVGGYFNLASAITTGDSINMVRMGEKMRPTKITLWARNKAGALTLSNTVFSCGVAPLSATQANFTRPTGQVFTPLTAAPALFGNLDLATDGEANITELVPPRATPDYAPYFITLTPVTSTVTPTGAHELHMEVQFVGEEDPTDPAYTSFP